MSFEDESMEDDDFDSEEMEDEDDDRSIHEDVVMESSDSNRSPKVSSVSTIK